MLEIPNISSRQLGSANIMIDLTKLLLCWQLSTKRTTLFYSGLGLAEQPIWNSPAIASTQLRVQILFYNVRTWVCIFRKDWFMLGLKLLCWANPAIIWIFVCFTFVSSLVSCGLSQRSSCVDITNQIYNKCNTDSHLFSNLFIFFLLESLFQETRNTIT